METDANEAVVQLARALSDPTRIRIAAALIEQELTLEQIAIAAGVRPADIARHLKLLHDSGLVDEVPDDQPPHFRLDLDALRRISRAAFATPRSSSPETDGDAFDQKVLRDFVKDDRLTSIPATHKKKLVILRWLTTLVPEDVRLSEREISTFLKQYHPDFATLRRELVDNGFLQRDRGFYWRTTVSPHDDGSSTP